jgi:hypothetical protein
MIPLLICVRKERYCFIKIKHPYKLLIKYKKLTVIPNLRVRPEGAEKGVIEDIVYRLCWLIQTFIVNAPNLFLAVCWL